MKRLSADWNSKTIDRASALRAAGFDNATIVHHSELLWEMLPEDVRSRLRACHRTPRLDAAPGLKETLRRAVQEVVGWKSWQRSRDPFGGQPEASTHGPFSAAGPGAPATQQARMARWVETRGLCLFDSPERTSRFWEELAELLQACGASKEVVLRIVDVVFSKPKGEIDQELGGAAITLLALAECHGVDLYAATDKELDRVYSLPVERFRNRNLRNLADGIGCAPGPASPFPPLPGPVATMETASAEVPAAAVKPLPVREQIARECYYTARRMSQDWPEWEQLREEQQIPWLKSADRSLRLSSAGNICS